MVTFNLDILPQTVFAFMLVFARVGTMVMLMPALGEMSISARIRLLIGLTIAAVLLPSVGGYYPQVPSQIGVLASLVIFEILIGLFIGLTARLTMSALQIAGTAIAFQSGLAFAQNVDPTQGIQSALIGTFLAVTAVALIFVSDLHHVLIAAMRDSFVLFKPGAPLPVGDFVEMATSVVSGAFKLGVQIAAPFLVFGLVFYAGLGVLSRLMPQIQVFFIAMPLNIMLAFVLLMVLMSGMMMWFLDYFETTMIRFVAG